jgi:tyrosine-protein phosphatase SIW14
MLRPVIVLLLLPAMTIWGSLFSIPGHGEIPRFLMVADGLYRGGQPTEQGFQLLKAKGIKTVINLRMENDESELVQRLGMNYVHIPVEDVRPWSEIPAAAIAKYFELVNNRANYPIFFHCYRGADRTGAMAALYRIALQGWAAREAYREARYIGMRVWFRGLKDQIYDFHPPAPAKLQPAMQAQ